MTTVLRQSDGPLILTMPKAFLEATITPGYALDALVEGMTPENSHESLDAGERGPERVEW